MNNEITGSAMNPMVLIVENEPTEEADVSAVAQDATVLIEEESQNGMGR